MKTISKTKYVLLALLVVFSISCSTEDGNDGAMGPAGQNGTDGNANVIVKTVEANPGPSLNWTAGSYLGIDSNVFEINDNDITQDVADKSLILVHFQLYGEETWYPMTYSFPAGNGDDEVITFTYKLNNLTIYALTGNGVLNARINKLKYFIIDSSNSRVQNGENLKMSHDELLDYFDLEE